MSTKTETAKDVKTRRFAAIVESLRKRAEKILEHTNNHLGVSPEDVTWGDIEEAAYLNSQLKEISDRLFHEGEYSKN
jgi:hypothetical protein